MGEQHVLADLPHPALVDLETEVIDQVGSCVVTWDDGDGKRGENCVAAIANSQLYSVPVRKKMGNIRLF